MEVNGVGAQDEHFLLPPNRWTNREDELGDPTILKKIMWRQINKIGWTTWN